jgi:antitoxin component of MazEF toxin-antitoxin module
MKDLNLTQGREVEVKIHKEAAKATKRELPVPVPFGALL